MNSFHLKPHTAYQPSGVPWLGDMPEHWEVQRGKALLVPVDIRSTTGGEELLTVSAQRGVIPRDTANVTMFKAESYEGYKLCWPGDLVINSLWAWAHGLGVSQHHGIVSSAYGVYRPLPMADARFIHLLVRSVPFQWELQVRSKGIWVSRLQLTDEAFLRAPFPLPPLTEQRAIVRYLDYVDRRIRRYVTAKRKLIALLEEEKQAIVNQAVTHGLDPNVRLKPSGVEWLGDVPEHWQVGPVKHAFLSMDYGISASASDSGAIRLLTMGHLKDGRVIVPNDGGVDFVVPHLLLEEGDLLFNRTNSQELVGKVGLFIGHDSPVTFASYLVRMRPHPNHEPEYLNMALNGASLTSRARREAIPSLHQSNLNPTRFGRIHIALPSKEEQSAILRALRKETASLGAAVSRARRQIKLMEEYRTRLIADVVTGKLDVREASAQLPDEDGDQDPIGESRPLADGLPRDLYDIDESVEDSVIEEEVTA